MSDKANVEMREFWNGEGGQKWLRFRERTDKGLAPFGEEAMAAAVFSAGEEVIDIGCGCGDTSFEIAKRVGFDGYILGIDISKLILESPKARAASNNKRNISFESCDAQTHPFKPKAFDVVFSRFGIMFFDEPITAFRNIRKSLKPGGRLAFICWQPAKDNEWISLPLSVASKHVQLPASGNPDEPGPLAFGNADRVTDILSSAGFSNTKIEGSYIPFNIGRNLDEALEFLTQMGPASGAVNESGADEATKIRIAADLRKTLEPYVTEQGVILGAATWVVTARNS